MRATASLLARLRAARNAFGAAAERDKRALLRALATATLATPAQVSALHEDLLFLCAFPGSRATRALARRMLAGIGARVRRLSRAQRAALDDSGIAESTTRHVFPFPVAHWVARAAPADAEIDWRNVDDPAVLDALVRPLLTDSEREAFDSGEFATRDWMRRARRADARSDLEWLMASAAASAAGTQRVADAWDDAEIPVAWQLRESRASVTHNALRRRAGGPALGDAPSRGRRDRRHRASAAVRRAPAARARAAGGDGRARGARRAVPRSERDDVSQPRRGLVVRPGRGRGARRDRHRARAAPDAGDEHGLPAVRQRRADRLRRRDAALPAGEHRHQRLRPVPRQRGGVPVDADAARVPHALRQRPVRRQRVPVRRRQRRGDRERRVLVLLPAGLPARERAAHAGSPRARRSGWPRTGSTAATRGR